MRPTTSALILVALLAFAPAAAAKGPHASVASGPAGLEPGEPWVTTLTLVEYSGRDALPARPTVILRSGSARFAVNPRRTALHVPGRSDMLAEARYRLRVVFPRAGRWSYTVVDGTKPNRRFRFPAATIGGDAERVRTGYVAFPQGSPEQAQGGGGPVIADAVPASAEAGGALPPEVTLPPEDEERGLALWIPAAGLVLAGVGALTVLRRHQARAPRRSGSAPAGRSARP